MSWQLLDGPSRKPRVSWAVPEHLRDNSRYGPFRRQATPAPLDPDALLQYIDNAISITENAQASRHLSLIFASLSSSLSSSSSSAAAASSLTLSSSPSSSSSPSPSSSSSSSVSHLHDGGPLVPAAHRMSRFKSVPLQLSDDINDHREAMPTSRLNMTSVLKLTNAQPLDEQESTKIDRSPSKLAGRTQSQQFSEVKGASTGDLIPAKGEEYDARAADDAYRAACCALSEGDAELALSLLHVASVKCPPEKQSALGKVHRLMAAAIQLVEKNSAVLRSFPVAKDAL